MSVLEFAAEEKVGLTVLIRYPEIAKGLREMESQLSGASNESLPEHERKRMKHILDLCFEYDREGNDAERKNIADTLLELIQNEDLELPNQSLSDWKRCVQKENTR